MSVDLAAQGGCKINIALKFCGSCNPEIDLSALARNVGMLTSNRQAIRFVSCDTPRLDLLVVLCGCRRACVDKEEYRSRAKQHILIAGESLDGSPQSENQLASLISSEIDRLR